MGKDGVLLNSYNYKRAGKELSSLFIAIYPS